MFFLNLKERFLNDLGPLLGVMDSLCNFEKVFREEFVHAKEERCQVYAG